MRVCAGPVRWWAVLRRTAYRRGWVRTYQLPQPVISIGNLTVGGTGKTPLVIWLARRLHASGRTVAILSRGYGRKIPSDNLMVSDGKELKTTWQLAGDEPFLIAQKCPWAVVAVGKNRYELGSWVNERVRCDCFILDDGYQHLRLHRNINIVLFDAMDTDGIKGVLPAGRLREPLTAVRDATFVVITRITSEESAETVVRTLQAKAGDSIAPLYLKTCLLTCRHLSTGVRSPLAEYDRQPVLVFSGIGHGGAFLDDLRARGVDVVKDIRFPDHYEYSAQTLDWIRGVLKDQAIPVALTTEKDAVKIMEWIIPDDRIAAVEMDVEWFRGEQEVMRALDDLWTAPEDR